MEKYPAFDERPLDKCLADVSRADAYVLLLAHRYGFRPKEEGNPERSSITELEYNEAGRHEMALSHYLDDFKEQSGGPDRA